MITLHHLNNSRSHRILWLLEELELEYTIQFYKRDPETLLAPQSLRKIHPLGKSPILTDGRHVIVESGAIIQFLLDRYSHGKLRPPVDSDEYLRFNHWMHYAEGSLMPPLLMSLVFQRIEEAPVPFFVKPVVKGIVEKVRSSFIRPQTALHLDFVDSELSHRDWMCGSQFTAADIQMSFPLEVSTSRDDASSKRKNIQAFIGRIKSRPAYQRAELKGGTVGFDQ